MNRKFKNYFFAAILGMSAFGCASTQAPSYAPSHSVVLKVANTGADAETLQSAMTAKRDAWYFDVADGDSGTFNTLRPNESGYAVCLSPDRAYDAEGKATKYLPMTCGNISKANAAQDILALYDEQFRNGVDTTLSHAEMRDILNHSTPEDPKCFSFIPLWLTDKHLFATEPALSEAYLITCARKIKPDDDEKTFMLSERLSAWLNMTAATLTLNSDFVTKVFRLALSHNDAETLVLGQALEARAEIYAAKWTQSQMTLSAALNANERLAIDWVSEILAMMLYKSITDAPTLDTTVFEQAAQALAPQKPTDLRLDVRNIVLQQVCMLSTTLADVTPELVDACLGAIALGFLSSNEEVHDNYAYMLERAVTGRNHAYLTDATRTWIGQFCQETQCPWIQELSRAALATPGLQADTRTFFESTQFKETK